MGTVDPKLLEAALIAKATREPQPLFVLRDKAYEYLRLLGLVKDIPTNPHMTKDIVVSLAHKKILHIDYIGSMIAYVRLHHDYKPE